MDINELFQLAQERQASDLHVIPGYFPTLRINGELVQIKTSQLITSEISEKIILPLLNEEQKDNFFANNEIDISYAFDNNRYRLNIYNTQGYIAAAFRVIASQIKTLDELNLPPVMHQFTDLNQGLVLITGQTGEGKSTTLASIINEINTRYSKHIITIEDPIEYIYPKSRSIISQRELHKDTFSWQLALKSVLREDPDVVLVGEMRDTETIQSVLTIAETGHLVFSTLHTGSTPESINRIIDVFPSQKQSQIRSQLSSVLKAVVSQKLLITADKTKRIPAIELLFNIPAVAANIRDSRTHQLDNILETSEDKGLIIFEKYLASLFYKGLITRETALSQAIRETEIKKFLK